jgi:chromate transporter
MSEERTSLRELALLFLRLGTTAFGGPAAHIAMMQDEVVRRRAWLTEERFLDMLGATNLTPGPNSTEMAIHIGWERRRFAGLAVAGSAFILPAALITGALGWVYVRYGALPAAGFVLYGVKPVMVGVVAHALGKLAPKAARNLGLRALGLACAALVVIGANEIAVLFGAGAAAAIAARVRAGKAPPSPAASSSSESSATPPPPSKTTKSGALLAPWIPVAAAGGAAGAVTLPSLFWLFLKIGSVLFGSGYVLLAFLRSDLVERLHWLTEGQLIDSVAVGQVTPGPVFTTATFIGYVLAGPKGALVATLGIFLPAFVFVALSGPLIPRMRRSRLAGAFLDGVNVASLALMAVVTVQLGRAALIDPITVLLALASLFVLVRFEKVNTTWLVLAGATIGWAAHAAGLAAR